MKLSKLRATPVVSQRQLKEEFFEQELFLDIPFAVTNYENLFHYIVSHSKRIGVSINFLAAHAVVELCKNPELVSHKSSQIFITDSKPFYRYLRFFNKGFHQIRGTDFLKNAIIEDESQVSHFFLGSSPEVLTGLVNAATQLNSKIRVVGTFSPSYTDDWDILVAQSVEAIRISKPDIVWIGLGVPKQIYVAEELAKLFPGFFVSVGAAFDFISGNSKEAPIFFRKLYLEWFYRLMKDPHRLFKRYTYVNLVFVKLILKDLIRRKTR